MTPIVFVRQLAGRVGSGCARCGSRDRVSTVVRGRAAAVAAKLSVATGMGEA